jgi:hypothetical protein
MVGSSYSVAERRAGVEPARPNFTSAIDAEDPTTELSATARTAPPFMTFHGCRSAVGPIARRRTLAVRPQQALADVVQKRSLSDASERERDGRSAG